MDNAMLECRLQREDYLMKSRRTIYSYGLNERAKFMNKNSPRSKIFPVLLRCGECFVDTRTGPKITNHDLSSDIEIFFNFLKQFSIKYRSNECRKLLERKEKLEKRKEKRTTYLSYLIIIIFYFNNKGLDFIHLDSILHENGIINCLPVDSISCIYSFQYNQK